METRKAVRSMMVKHKETRGAGEESHYRMRQGLGFLHRKQRIHSGGAHSSDQTRFRKADCQGSTLSL